MAKKQEDTKKEVAAVEEGSAVVAETKKSVKQDSADSVKKDSAGKKNTEQTGADQAGKAEQGDKNVDKKAEKQQEVRSKVEKQDTENVHKDIKEVSGLVDIDEEAKEATLAAQQKKQSHSRCPLCDIRYPYAVHFSDVSTLKKFMSVRGNIIARGKSGVCAKHQRALRRAIGQARYLSLLPYVDTGV